MNTHNEKLDNLSTVFGFSAVITMLVSTVLAWVKDSYKPLELFMTAIGGHHWITHGIFDILLFLSLGILFYRMNFIEHFKSEKIIKMLIISTLVSSLGLVGWFFFL